MICFKKTAKKNYISISKFGFAGGLLKDFIAKRQATTENESYFGLYVEKRLKNLPGSIRREAEFRIQQVLHDSEDMAENHNFSTNRHEYYQQPFQARLTELTYE